MSVILCIDTASDRFAVGTEREGRVEVVTAAEERTHTTGLLAAIERLLGGEKPAAILVVSGPGSYAGLRVGISTAQGLALATGAPLFGLRTFEAVALAVGSDRDVRAIHPAGRGEFGVQEWKHGKPAGEIRLVAALEPGPQLAGEGAGALGGTEVGPEERCRALLASLAPRVRAGELEPGAEPFYLREPAVTLSRRLRVSG